MIAPETADDTSARALPTVTAAGGVVLDRDGDVAHVLVVHRPTYGDWSLPKGHVDPGERPADAAVREVVEETGVRVDVAGTAGTTEHRVTVTRDRTELDASKRVHWFVMHPVEDADDPSDRTPDQEVDRAEWWPITRALTELTYTSERALLARVLDASGSGEVR